MSNSMGRPSIEVMLIMVGTMSAGVFPNHKYYNAHNIYDKMSKKKV